MDATRLIVVRHGETAWNVDTRIQGHLDIPLNATGLWQARQLGDALAGEAISAIYTSDLLRARKTAQAVADATGAALVDEPGLRERVFGAFQGCTFAEVETEHPEQARRWRQRDPDYAPDGGESLRVLRERVVDTTHRLAARHPGAGAAGDAWRRARRAVPRRHAPRHPGTAHLAARQRRHQPPAVDPRARPVPGRLGRYAAPRTRHTR